MAKQLVPDLLTDGNCRQTFYARKYTTANKQVSTKSIQGRITIIPKDGGKNYVRRVAKKAIREHWHPPIERTLGS